MLYLFMNYFEFESYSQVYYYEKSIWFRSLSLGFRLEEIDLPVSKQYKKQSKYLRKVFLSNILSILIQSCMNSLFQCLKHLLASIFLLALSQKVMIHLNSLDNAKTSVQSEFVIFSIGPASKDLVAWCLRKCYLVALYFSSALSWNNIDLLLIIW